MTSRCAVKAVTLRCVPGLAQSFRDANQISMGLLLMWASSNVSCCTDGKDMNGDQSGLQSAWLRMCSDPLEVGLGRVKTDSTPILHHNSHTTARQSSTLISLRFDNNKWQALDQVTVCLCMWEPIAVCQLGYFRNLILNHFRPTQTLNATHQMLQPD